MMLKELREQVWQANLQLKIQNLVIYSWGNVSGIDRAKGIVLIKPSGVDYDALRPEDLVALDLEGRVVEGTLRPSSDTPTHLELYRRFEKVGGICHTHSLYATIWAQACREIPCFGTTHADNFYGPVPVTDPMQPEEIEGDYELNTGKVIVRRFAGLDPMQVPAVLVANHGPFTWGPNAEKAVENAVVLEQCAQMALGTLQLNPEQPEISRVLLDKHYLRKHGKNAYYGQK
ncbi:MAG TPA: L-ribulose-5-phosphate 4-epimerase [Anaerohalosphaeraceae bacterium]|nr:L-ribulose-5-phosphate 4-epimerase [Anaerohalosphaeraceae bacterium]HOL88340.1 L-ribulose-5-phosphate 4-epimerase [Anaerohalosphaeraceae bacterium]HPP57028.1 L-ribulose-5-phosphate 4-epimerase [Anaerohalosphaeraceae bacterium]